MLGSIREIVDHRRAWQQLPVLLVGHDQLAPYCHSPQSQRILALRGVNVEFVRRMIRVDQIGSHRPSYINAIVELTRIPPVSIVSQTATDRSHRAAVRLVTLEGAAPIANGATGEVAAPTTTSWMWQRMI
jgi:hypothetical protein